MMIDEAVVFFQKVPPFQFLDEQSLRRLGGTLSMEFFPRETVILQQDDPPAEFLMVIKRGGVKVFLRKADGEETTIDYRGEGENFGFLSLLGRESQRTTIMAIEDTICYLIPRSAILKLLDSNPAFTEYLLQTHFNKYVHRNYSEIQNKSLLHGSSDILLFTTRIGEIMTHPVVTIPAATSIRDAALAMDQHRVSSLIVTDAAGVASGIITDKDLRTRVIGPGLEYSEPVSSVASPALIRVDAKDHCFDALLKMTKYKVHHLPVIKDGVLHGMVTNHDLLILQGRSPLAFVKDIDNQISLDGLAPISVKISRLIGLLLKEGAHTGNIASIITELNDRLIRRVLTLADQHFGPPPVPFAWIVFGSEGRKEQTFKTDQDNALIHADVSGERQAAAAREYFRDYANFVNDGLIRCGFPPCPAGYMARNPQWCQSESAWKKFFEALISTPTAEALTRSLILFDFRFMHGDQQLADDLKEFVLNHVRNETVFLGSMANIIIHNRPPIGLLKSFVVEKSGEHKDKLNLKIKGIIPIVDILRLFSLERGLRETSSLDRLRVLREKNTLIGEYGEDIGDAFNFITLLRIHNQSGQMESGASVDNFINPNQLSNLEKRSIKDAFTLISKLQDAIVERYKALIW